VEFYEGGFAAGLAKLTCYTWQNKLARRTRLGLSKGHRKRTENLHVWKTSKREDAKDYMVNEPMEGASSYECDIEVEEEEVKL